MDKDVATMPKLLCVTTMMALLLCFNCNLLAVLLLALGVIVVTMVVVFSQVVKLSGGIASTIVVDPVVDPSEISSVGYHLDLTETQARREQGTRGSQRGTAAVNSGNSIPAPWVAIHHLQISSFDLVAKSWNV